MEVDPKTAPAKNEYKGKTYYFCAPGCKVAFEKDPEKYLKGEGGHAHLIHCNRGWLVIEDPPPLLSEE
jgi:YHS domain-containing protein